jgi:hypothetical protein
MTKDKPNHVLLDQPKLRIKKQKGKYFISDTSQNQIIELKC